MKTRRHLRRMIIGGMLALLVSVIPVKGRAATLDELIDRVNVEYVGGAIADRDMRDNLLLMLNDAKYAPTPEDRSAIVESFRTLVSSLTGEKILAAAADTLLGMASGY